MANPNTTLTSPRVNDVLSTIVKPSVPLSPTLSPSASQAIYKASSKVSSSPLVASQSSPLVEVKSLPLSSTVSSTLSSQSKPSILKYSLLFIFLIFLIVTLILYLIKPESTKIVDIYAPIITFFSKKSDTTRKDNTLENVINDKKIQSSDNSEQSQSQSQSNVTIEPISVNKDVAKDDEEVKLIPVSNDTDDPIQSTSRTKTRSCYIGTDRGFRNCVSIGEGEEDKCMSGAIFPTLDMCINPKLRE